MASSEEVQAVAPRAGILDTLRRPAVLLVLLATWDIVGAVVQLLGMGAFFELDQTADGILAGQALGTAMVVPAVVYLYAARDVERFRRVFWLALIEHIVAIASYFYHWGRDDIGIEGVVIPTVVSGGFLFLILLVMFVPQPQAPAPPAAGQPPTPSQ
jgi:hypothetical protein